jgi:hypothetical protein
VTRTGRRIYVLLLAAFGALAMMGATPVEQSGAGAWLAELADGCTHPVVAALVFFAGVLLPQPGKVARQMEKDAQTQAEREKVAAELAELRQRRTADHLELLKLRAESEARSRSNG